MRTELAKDVLICAVLTSCLWAPLGRWFLWKIGGKNLPDPWHLAVALGMAIWGMLVLTIGLAGLLYRTFLVCLAAVLFLLLKLHDHLRTHNPGPQSAPVKPLIARLFIPAFLLLSLLFFLLVFASALAPESSFDGLNVHLPYARSAALANRIGFDPNNWSSVMPALPLMGYVTGFLLSGVTLAKLLNPLCYVLCGAWIFFMMRRWHGMLHGTVAAALFWTFPTAAYEAGTALIDLPLTLFSAIALLSLLEWARHEEPAFLRLSSVALGFALGCKYHAAFWVLPLLVILTVHTLWVRRRGADIWLRRVIGSAFLTALLVLPWVLRAWHYTGNPVFPVANGVFHSRYFTGAMEDAARAAYANEGIGHSFLALLRLPWAVTFHPGTFRGSLGAVFFFGFLAALWRRKTPELVYGFLLAGAYFYQWALSAQEIRYLLPLVPVLSVLATIGVLGGDESLEVSRPSLVGVSKATTHQIGTAAALLCVLLLSVMNLPFVYPRWVHEWTYWHGYQSPFPYLAGRMSREDYLLRDVPSIYIYNYINSRGSPRDRILLLNDASQYYSEMPTLYSFTVEGEELMLLETEEDVLRKLHESRITHVLLNYNGIAPLPGVAPRKGVYFFLDRGFQERYLEVIHSANNVVLYRVRA